MGGGVQYKSMFSTRLPPTDCLSALRRIVLPVPNLSGCRVKTVLPCTGVRLVRKETAQNLCYKRMKIRKPMEAATREFLPRKNRPPELSIRLVGLYAHHLMKQFLRFYWKHWNGHFGCRTTSMVRGNSNSALTVLWPNDDPTDLDDGRFCRRH